MVRTIMLALIFQGFNIYSPEIVMQNNQTVMYFGGWMSATDLPYDAIYRCPMPCTTPQEVIAPPYGSLVQVNDPTLVQMPAGYWIMYMTGSTSLGGELTSQGVYFATSWDGIAWSTPQLLIQGYWLPSAVLKDGRVYLYVNPTVSPNKQWRFDLGTSGVSVGTPVINTHAQAYNYANVDVAYHPTINLWQMVAENIGDLPASQIDYLYSSDGINWILGQAGIIVAPTGGSVRTPTMHPGTAYYIYYGCSNTRDGMSNQICFEDWSP
jgi:hypothetical protein